MRSFFITKNRYDIFIKKELTKNFLFVKITKKWYK